MSQHCGSKDRPGCGAPITWAVLGDGRKVPLDVTEPVYQLFAYDQGQKAYPIVRVAGHKVDHRSVCPLRKANRQGNQGTRPSGGGGASGRERAAGD